MTRHPIITIIVPVYNGEQVIARAVESVRRQSYTNWELILIDDGSVDGTAAIVDEFAENDCRVTARHFENGGQSSARNRALDCPLRGEYLLFLDADDELEPSCCHTLVEALDDDTDLLIFGFNIYSQDKLLRTPNPGDSECLASDWEKFSQHVYPLFASACNKLYKRNYIKCRFDESLVHSEDIIFNYQNLTETTKIKTLSACLYDVHLDNPTSVNKRYHLGRLADMVKVSLLMQNKIASLFEGHGYDRKRIERDVVLRILGDMERCGELLHLKTARHRGTRLL